MNTHNFDIVDHYTLNKGNIGIIDDHFIIREALKSSLSKKYHIVLEANDGLEMIAKFKNIEPTDYPEILIVDINMPNMNGFETVEWLKNNNPDIKIVVFTMADDGRSIEKMYNLGADCFLTKGKSTFDDIIHVIESVKKEGQYFTSDVAKILLNYKDNKAEEIITLSVIDALTEKERKVIYMLCNEVSGKDMGQELKITARSVENIVNGLFTKFKVKTRVGLVKKIIESGFLNQ